MFIVKKRSFQALKCLAKSCSEGLRKSSSRASEILTFQASECFRKNSFQALECLAKG
jgi:hypothetical protein